MAIKNIIFDVSGVLFEPTQQPDYLINAEYKGKFFKAITLAHAILKHYHTYVHPSTRFFICSNITDAERDALKNFFPELMALFTGIVIPSVAHAKKPEAAIYTYLLTQYNLQAHECVFLDDQETNVKAAQEVGMHGVHVVNSEHIAQALGDLLEAPLFIKKII